MSKGNKILLIVASFTDKGVKCKVCLVPEITGFDTELPYHNKWRDIASIMAAKIKFNRLKYNYNEPAKQLLYSYNLQT